MSTRTLKANLWLTSPEDSVRIATASSDKDYLHAVHLDASSCDMSRCGWTRVGTADVTLYLEENKVIQAGAVKAIDAAIEKVRQDFSARIKELQDARASLLALPASVYGECHE